MLLAGLILFCVTLILLKWYIRERFGFIRMIGYGLVVGYSLPLLTVAFGGSFTEVVHSGYDRFPEFYPVHRLMDWAPTAASLLGYHLFCIVGGLVILFFPSDTKPTQKAEREEETDG